MARYSGASWRPAYRNYTPGGQSSVRGLVVHIMAGTLAGSDDWFRNHSEAQASAHFGTNKGSTIYQWVDTKDRAWAQSSGNSSWLSIENEGQGGDYLTDAQMTSIAKVFAWVHSVYGTPLQISHSPSTPGLGYHSMGGSAWGGHSACPGSHIVGQLQTIVNRAKTLAGGGAVSTKPNAYLGAVAYGATHAVADERKHTGYRASIFLVQDALADKGLLDRKYVTGEFGTSAKSAYKKYQVSLGYTGSDADGVPGETSMGKLLPDFSISTAVGPEAAAVSVTAVKYGAENSDANEEKHPEYRPDVLAVQYALVTKKLLTPTYVTGIFGQGTKDAYQAFQKSLGYTGSAADGVPGADSLKKLLPGYKVV